jgi:hypothetical protein
LVAAPRALGQDRLPARQSGAGRLRLLADEQATVPIDHGAHARLRDYISTSFLGGAEPVLDGIAIGFAHAGRLVERTDVERSGEAPPRPEADGPRSGYNGAEVPAPPTIQQTQHAERASARRVAPSHCHPESVMFNGSRAKSGCASDQ